LTALLMSSRSILVPLRISQSVFKRSGIRFAGRKRVKNKNPALI
jgi:hypothetical protein